MLRSIGISLSIVLAAAIGAGSGALAQKAKQKTAAVGSAQPTLLGQYGDWGAYTASPDGKKVCFALGKPKSQETEPPGRKRDPAYLFISTRPDEDVRNEVSVIMGYPLRANADASAEVGPTKFAMHTQNDGAWIKNTTEETRMIDTMRKGADMTVRGVSSRGTRTIDEYSLKGLSQALDRATAECK